VLRRCCLIAFFFFSSRRRHTRSKRDWSSDVCSSDLAGTIQTLVGDWDLGEQFTSDTTLSEVDDSGYDILVVPGGTLNADSLRLNDDAQRIVKSFASSGRPVASLCH